MTPLRQLKTQGIRIQWRVCPQLLPENQWQNKYVESTRVLCLESLRRPFVLKCPDVSVAVSGCL